MFSRLLTGHMSTECAMPDSSRIKLVAESFGIDHIIANADIEPEEVLTLLINEGYDIDLDIYFYQDEEGLTNEL